MTCFLAKFQRSTRFIRPSLGFADPIPETSATIFLPITSSSTLASLRVAFLDALTQSRPTDSPELELEPEELPSSAGEIAFWKAEGEDEGEPQWVQLKDEKSGADKWGL